ncbi:MAG: hypothetical protein P4K93_03060 [Terracidiphilus sp.]|nr:hypothetical protein [Terracidiphilus sp.]MDR3797104.1 hypothetical protein [Terracidiphilus sp.]
MHRRALRIMMVALAVAAAGVGGALVAAQEIKVNVTYVCNGERIVIDNCNMRDTSDTSTCMVGHPDTVLANGLMKYTYETRGNLKKLLPTCKQPTAQELAREEAFKKKQQQIYDENVAKANPQPAAQTPQAGGSGGAGNPAGVTPPKNAEERALRRCVSSGRPASTCTGNGLLGAFTQMVSQVLPGADKQPAPGPNMAGVFVGAGGWRLDFIDGGVLVNCAGLSPNQESYALDLKNGHATLTIATTPRPLVLAVHGDGTIAGPPGPVTIDGVIAAGYVSGAAGTGATQKDQYGNLYDPAGNRVPGNANNGYTQFAPKRVTCSAINLTSKGAGVGVQTMETDLLKSMVGGDKGPATPRGIRMHGIFAAPTGFSVQFFPESVILGCGPDAARAYPYTVEVGAGGAVVKIAAADHPLTLAFRADGSLDPGSTGPYQVHGRIVTGQDDNDDFTFAPMEMTCKLGVMTPSQQIPASGGGPAMMNAGGGSASPAGGGGLSTPAAPLGNAVLSVIPGLAAQPGALNPLAGHPYVLLRSSYADAIASAGVPVPPGVSPYMYMGTACGNRTPDCQKMMNAINADAASAVRADANGRGTLPGVPPGVYYLMISTRYNNQALVWDRAIELRAGTNSVTLSLSNATAIK